MLQLLALPVELERPQRTETRPVEKVATLLPRMADQYRELVTNLESDLQSHSIPRARATLRKLLRDIQVTATEDEVLFANDVLRDEAGTVCQASESAKGRDLWLGPLVCQVPVAPSPQARNPPCSGSPGAVCG